MEAQRNKLMSRLRFILMTTIFAASLLFSGCGVETNKRRALHAKHNAEMRRLLVALEIFRDNSGKLPTSLGELQKSDDTIRNIGIQAYGYSAEGIVVADGTRWLLTLPDPENSTQMLVGRLPVEIAVRKPKQP